jgi:transposase
MSAAFIGIDLTKLVIQVLGIDICGKLVVTKSLRRDMMLTFFANLALCVVGLIASSEAYFQD